jgi:hypothetical protein
MAKTKSAARANRDNRAGFIKADTWSNTAESQADQEPRDAWQPIRAVVLRIIERLAPRFRQAGGWL